MAHSIHYEFNQFFLITPTKNKKYNVFVRVVATVGKVINLSRQVLPCQTSRAARCSSSHTRAPRSWSPCPPRCWTPSAAGWCYQCETSCRCRWAGAARGRARRSTRSRPPPARWCGAGRAAPR